jgi:hypothetical protein
MHEQDQHIYIYIHTHAFESTHHAGTELPILLRVQNLHSSCKSTVVQVATRQTDRQTERERGEREHKVSW